MQRFLLIILFIFVVSACRSKHIVGIESSQSLTTNLQTTAELINGPMLGYSTMKEVAIWIQGQTGSSYQLIYSVNDGQEQRSKEVTIGGTNNNTALLYARDIEPGLTYNYRVEATMLQNRVTVGEGQFQSQPLWQWRSDPPAFSFALGSCTYINESAYDRPGEPYGGQYEIFESIYQKNPDFMVWGGDNTYLREVDWNSMTGIWNRYTHSRAIPEMKNLLANVHHYATWDDHDYGPNNSDRSFFMKDSTYMAFKKFWANPTYGINGNGGITSKFQWNDCDFFILDNRYFRTPNDRKSGKRHILGEDQVEWLIDNLVNSRASFKFIIVGGQFLSTVAKYENHATFPNERNRLIDLIYQERIKNVIFLTGDRHHSEISFLKEDGQPSIYDITVSPLTSGTHQANDEGNKNQVKGSLINDRNFALLTIDGKWGERVLTLSYNDVNGKRLFTYTIPQVQ